MSIASCMTDVPHPGVFIAEELEARDWLQRDLAYILGVPEQTVNMIVSGKRGISPEMAKALGDAFDVAPAFFSNLQNAYEMSKARAPDPAVARRALLQSIFPVREMIKRAWLEDTDVPLLEAQLMRFFRRNDLTAITHMAHASKKSGDYATDTPAQLAAQLAWLFRVRQICSEMITPAYSEARLRQAIAEFPRYMVDPEEVRHVPRILNDCGVRFAIVETFPKAKIDGVCFWEDHQTPVVGMSTRFDRIDNFWFVLRHELEHVLNKDGRGKSDEDVSVDTDLQSDNAHHLPPEEVRANAAAADFCVPTEELNSFFLRKAPYIGEKDVLGFARRIQRHPGIVVGQLQRLMERPEYLARLKVKVRQFVAQSAVVDGWGVPAPVQL
ncbi:HigA family addiction module antitoxin [Sphingomonas spermidinifaciens]|nr:HigA family addiction module antitoxin [Sphingomonas spermidinifaciens]